MSPPPCSQGCIFLIYDRTRERITIAEPKNTCFWDLVSDCRAYLGGKWGKVGWGGCHRPLDGGQSTSGTPPHSLYGPRQGISPFRASFPANYLFFLKTTMTPSSLGLDQVQMWCDGRCVPTSLKPDSQHHPYSTDGKSKFRKAKSLMKV